MESDAKHNNYNHKLNPYYGKSKGILYFVCSQ